MAESTDPRQGNELSDAARAHAGGGDVRLRIDTRNVETFYANAFRSNASTEELIVDLGLNQVVPAGGTGEAGEQQKAEILFSVSHRMVLNYFAAKRLATSLSQFVRRYEERFGEIKLNADERVAPKDRGDDRAPPASARSPAPEDRLALDAARARARVGAPVAAGRADLRLVVCLGDDPGGCARESPAMDGAAATGRRGGLAADAFQPVARSLA
jgi:hypothetical protein